MTLNVPNWYLSFTFFGIFQKLKILLATLPLWLSTHPSNQWEPKAMTELNQNKKGEKPIKELKRNKRGLDSDQTLLELISGLHGLSQYEIGKKLKWPSGRVDGAIRRLLNEDRVFIKILERNGRHVNLVYPKEDKPSDTVEVPAKLLHVSNPTWLDSAFVYALDSTTVGISGHEMPEWKETSCFTEKIPIGKETGKLVFQIPERIKRFYNWERKHRVVSVNGNNILITISGNIIEEKKYPS